MDSARRFSTDTRSDGYEEVWKQGFFTKSPPLHLFTNQASWKRRYFMLSKSVKNGYVLRYLKGQHLKGSIEINKTSEIEIGISDIEKMAIVKKMFKCESKEVMTIRTENRIYYLVGSDSKETEEWATFLYAACHAQKPVQPASRSRSKSSPAALDELVPATDKKDLCCGNEYEVHNVDTFAYRKRPSSDPSPQEASEKDPIYESPKELLQCLQGVRNNHCIDSSEEQSEDKSKEEGYYASPRSILLQLDHTVAEYDIPGAPASPGDKDVDSGSDGEYMCMKNLTLEKKSQPTCTMDGLLTIPKSQEDNQKVVEGNSVKLTPQSRTFKPEKAPKLSSLSVVQLSIILGKITDDSQLKEVDVILPQEDLSNCLILTEAAGHICISQWKDPHRLGCIFHQGDYIVAVNELQVKSIDEISLFISRSTKKEVKMTVCRLPNSEILHTNGCTCSQEEK